MQNGAFRKFHLIPLLFIVRPKKVFRVLFSSNPVEHHSLVFLSKSTMTWKLYSTMVIKIKRIRIDSFT
jgi:hypothetical protein